MWVRSEYAGPFAVLSTWLCGLAPWSITWLSGSDVSGFLFWFHPVNFLFTIGAEIPGERPLWVWQFLDFPVYVGETYVTILWLAGSTVYLGALLFSIAYYLQEQRVERLPVDPVRTLGGLLLGSGLLLAGAYALLVSNHAGLSVPVGILLHIVFGITLVRAEQVERGDESTA